MCFTPGLKIFLVLSFFHSNKHHFCTCALFESFVVTVTPQWCAQGNWPTVNSLGIWVVDPARYAACWPLNFRMMCRISPILTSHCSKTVRWIMLHPPRGLPRSSIWLAVSESGMSSMLGLGRCVDDVVGLRSIWLQEQRAP